MVRVGINGFAVKQPIGTNVFLEPTKGRMGRLVARIILAKSEELDLELVHVNEKVGGSDMAAYLLEFDSTHGRFSQTVVAESENVLVVNGSKKIKYTRYTTPDAVPWLESDVEIVFECTGAFLLPEQIEGHLKRGARRVVVSAPVDTGGILNVVMGCNDHLVTSDMRIVTAASCTTNCAAPVVGALDEALGIEMGSINTVHNVTPTQSIMDVPNPGKKNDLRRARSGAVNLAPTTTGSAKAVAMIFPHLKGKLDGLAIRVPCQNASITDFVILSKRDTSTEEINAILERASQSRPHILGFETRALVSTDYTNDPRSSIVDALSTKVVNKRLIKVLSWYDNEWGYANRMAELGKLVASKLPHSQL